MEHFDEEFRADLELSRPGGLLGISEIGKGAKARSEHACDALNRKGHCYFNYKRRERINVKTVSLKKTNLAFFILSF